MDERGLFLAAAVFLVALATSMVRLGAHHGGRSWAAAWFFLYSAGMFSSLSARGVDGAALLSLTSATIFSSLLFRGASVYSGRFVDATRPLVIGTACVIAVRAAGRFLVGPEIDQSIGALANFASVAFSCWVFMHPRDGNPGPWNRALAVAFLAIAVVTAGFSYTRIMGGSMLPWMIAWLLTGIFLSSLKTGAFISIASERIIALRDEASRSQSDRAEIEARYRDVVEHASDLIAELDESGTILYANPAHHTTLGLPPGALTGRGANAIGIERESCANREPESEQSIASVVDAAGREIILESNVRRIPVRDGGHRVVVTSRDVTERQKLERARERMRSDLQARVDEQNRELESSQRELAESQRLASLGTMASGIAHQINNPIGAIRLAADFALNDSGDATSRVEDLEEALSHCRIQADRCGQIVSSMLQFARNQPLEKHPTDLAEIVTRACEQTNARATALGASIRSEGSPQSLPVMANSIELEQAILNILANACESRDEGAEVVVRAEIRDHEVALRVSDNGRGMSSTEAERVFEPFFTTRLRSGGTGLGLSVAHGIVKDHGGLLSIRSEVGVGTEVTVRLPLQG